MQSSFSRNKKSNKILFGLIIILGALIVFMVIMPKNVDEVYWKNYLIDLFCLTAILFLLLIYTLKNGFDLFDPIFFISAIYATLYFIAPIHDILIGKYTWFGYNLFLYGVKGSLISLAGYFSFFLFYFFSGNKLSNRIDIKTNNIDCVELGYKERTVLMIVIVAMYAICFAANVFYMVHSGYTNLLYILTLGLLGQEGDAATKIESIGFISMLSYSLPTVTLLYWNYGKSRILKIVLFVPMLMLQVTRGFRFFVIQIAITFFAYYFIRKRKRPRISTILLFLIIMMIPVLLMTLFRDSVRAGGGINIPSINGDSISEAFDQAFWENLRIYQNFYGMVAVIPSKYGYVYFRQIIIGTVIMVIPRILWSGKISTYGGAGLKTLIGSNIADGQAYPNLGEYYYAIGILGVIFFMSLYGWWMKHVRIRGADYEAGGLNNIIFAVLLGTNLQLIIRGYTPSNFWYVVFVIIPVYIIKFLFFNNKRG